MRDREIPVAASRRLEAIEEALTTLRSEQRGARREVWFWRIVVLLLLGFSARTPGLAEGESHRAKPEVAGSTLRAPFSVVDADGKAIFRVQAVDRAIDLPAELPPMRAQGVTAELLDEDGAPAIVLASLDSDHPRHAGSTISMFRDGRLRSLIQGQP